MARGWRWSTLPQRCVGELASFDAQCCSNIGRCFFLFFFCALATLTSPFPFLTLPQQQPVPAPPTDTGSGNVASNDLSHGVWHAPGRVMLFSQRHVTIYRHRSAHTPDEFTSDRRGAAKRKSKKRKDQSTAAVPPQQVACCAGS